MDESKNYEVRSNNEDGIDLLNELLGNCHLQNKELTLNNGHIICIYTWFVSQRKLGMLLTISSPSSLLFPITVLSVQQIQFVQSMPVIQPKLRI